MSDQEQGQLKQAHKEAKDIGTKTLLVSSRFIEVIYSFWVGYVIFYFTTSMEIQGYSETWASLCINTYSLLMISGNILFMLGLTKIISPKVIMGLSCFFLVASPIFLGVFMESGSISQIYLVFIFAGMNGLGRIFSEVISTYILFVYFPKNVKKYLFYGFQINGIMNFFSYLLMYSLRRYMDYLAVCLLISAVSFVVGLTYLSSFPEKPPEAQRNLEELDTPIQSPAKTRENLKIKPVLVLFHVLNGGIIYAVGSILMPILLFSYDHISSLNIAIFLIISSFLIIGISAIISQIMKKKLLSPNNELIFCSLIMIFGCFFLFYVETGELLEYFLIVLKIIGVAMCQGGSTGLWGLATNLAKEKHIKEFGFITPEWSQKYASLSGISFSIGFLLGTFLYLLISLVFSVEFCGIIVGMFCSVYLLVLVMLQSTQKKLTI